MLVGAGLAGEQVIAFQAVSWYQRTCGSRPCRRLFLGVVAVPNGRHSKLPLFNGSLSGSRAFNKLEM